MIDHFIHYHNDGFSYTWEMRLPFRLNKGDNLHHELLENKGKLLHDKEETDEWITHLFNNEYFEVVRASIDHNGDIDAWLGLPKQ